MNEISTKDLALAAALHVLGYHLLRAEPQANSTYHEFFFERSAGIEETIKEFWEKTLQVEPSDYFYSIRIIKNRINE